MLKRPGLSLLVVVTLAVGLAANAAIFSALDALLLRPLPLPNLPRLVRLWETAPGAPAYDRGNVAPGNFRDWQSSSSDVLDELVELIAGYVLVSASSLEDAARRATRYLDVVDAEEVDLRELQDH